MKISLIPQVGNETVHCSQGDTNRQWQFDIYGDKKIDIVDSPNPTYWIEKGGTEEILPNAIYNGYIYLDGDEAWVFQSINSYGIANFYIDVADALAGVENSCYCDKLPNQNTPIADTKTEGCYLNKQQRLFIRIESSKASTANEFCSWLSQNPMNFYYERTTSTPTTSPIKCDIQYTDGLRTDQEFTYRESPTTVDGSAKLKSIYGNTIVWNQLIRNGNFADGKSYYTASASTLTASNGVLTITKSQNTGSGVGYARPDNFNYVIGHKFLARVDYKGIAGKTLTVFSNAGNAGMTQITPTDNNWHTVSKIFDVASSPSVPGILWLSYETTTDDNVAQFRNYAIFDLTAMFGSGNEPSTVEEFTKLYPLPYYQYEQGKLLSFNGSGVKTVGFNLWDEETAHGYFSPSGAWESSDQHVASKNPIPVLPNTTYYCALVNGNTNIYLTQWTKPVPSGASGVTQWFIGRNVSSIQNSTFVTDPNCHAIHINCGSAYGSTYNHDICINISSSENGKYEPYQTSTLDIPTSTYFSTGMKSAGSVYDELSNNKAITRIGSLKGSDIQGSVSSAVSTGGFHYVEVTGLGSKASGQGISNMLPINNDNAWSSTVPCIQIRSTEGSIRIYGSFTTFQEFQTQYASLVIYYELATPTETNITSATMVTEYGESDLDSNGVVICNEGMSKYSGFHDAKIRVSDGDGDVYSAKFQVYVERKPK